MNDIFEKSERRNAELWRIQQSLDRWHRKLSRAVTAIDKLRAEHKRLLKRPLDRQQNALKITGEEETKIHHMDFGDEIPDFLRQT